MKRNLSSLLAALLAVSVLAGCGPKDNPAASSVPPAASSAPGSGEPAAGSYRLPKVMVLSGPTGVGAAKLMADEENASDPARVPEPAGGRGNCTGGVSVAASNDEVTAALINGDADIAAIATNVAANLCEKTGGGIQVLAVNTLGVLYILEKGDAVRSMADLRGRTLYAPSTAKGANPEYVLNYLLAANGVQPGEVNVEWLTPQEITVKLTSSDSGICMLPVPAATALLVQDEGVREALSLSDEWDKLDRGRLAMGCLVARTDYIEENPQGVENFLAVYQESIAYMSDEANREEAAKLAVRYDLAPNEKAAARAIPQCNLTYLAGAEMKGVLQEYYGILFRADPASIGGSLPYDSFYYGTP